MKPLFFFLMLSSGIVQAQITLSVKVPQDTPQGARIYMASSLNGWNPQDENFELKKSGDGSFGITIPEQQKPAEYKLTQGSWQTAEGDANGNKTENRRLPFTGKPQNLKINVLTWDKAAAKKSTASANVKILSENFEIPQLQTTRRIWIYLPRDYTTSTKKYPVIYMMDGQNLFDDATSFSCEWKVDETMDNLFGKTKSAIIVGIDNGGSERLNEYSAWKNMQYGGGKGEAFAAFLAENLKPYIDKQYRTLPQARNTGLIGSSMGGLISFYTGVKYPQHFGRLGIFSPSFWFAPAEIREFVQLSPTRLKNSKFYFVAGQNESVEMVSDIKKMIPLLRIRKVPENQINTKFDEDGTHTESYWAREFPAAYRWLFGF